MTRQAGSRLVRAVTVAAFVLAIAAPDVGAHHGAGAADPRCQPGYPAEPGVDLRGLCGDPAPIVAPGDADAGTTRLLPYVGAALVTGVALSFVAVLALRYRRPVARPGRPASRAWWVCPACRSMNAGGRPACYGCGTTRTATDPTEPQALDQAVGRPAG